MRFASSDALFERARAVIPGGIAGIRAPGNFVEGQYPKFLSGGQGGRVRDPDGNTYVDLLLGYGPIILGHAEPRVDQAAAARAAEGFCLNLPQPPMVELAETLTRLVPSAEQCLFFKTGSDATTAAVRLARAHTGRPKILRCGYHGWHDWCVEDDPGVPASQRGEVLAFPYNDAAALAALLDAHREQVAAIMLTPLGHDFDAQIELPQPGFLASVRGLAERHGVLLVFDEVRTGFRIDLGGAQARFGVTPDLTALGKAMANGYPITALVGGRDVMESSAKTFISSTYFPNGMEMAAALATLTALTERDVLGEIRAAGARLREGMQAVLTETGLPATLSPLEELPFLHFDTSADPSHGALRDRFYGALAGHGVFAHPRHHGFLCARHNDADLDQVVEALRDVARSL
ncbi:MAG: aminotransferase class III-fold pyridoxal phosphate-dependent enzyme [Pseudomonadales bacterium]